ncbi:MAG: hypothetical protein JST53_02875 [Actinobacteria bacterium]|nr:hypothetical protein [Actinomycetota bacterium]
MRSHQLTLEVAARDRSRPASRFGRTSLAPGGGRSSVLSSTFLVEKDWRQEETEVVQGDATARIVVRDDGELEAAARQVCRFLSLDVDARGWSEVARRDPVIASARVARPTAGNRWRRPIWRL